MKKNLFVIISAFLLAVTQATAGNVLTISDVNVPQGKQATLEVGCQFDTEYTAFELQLSLPEGLTLLTDEDGYPIIEKAFDTNHILTGNLLPSNGNYKITCRSMENLSIPTNGPLFRVTVVANGTLSVGTKLPASITASEFTRTADSNGETLEDVPFVVNIVEFRVLLDESSTTEPEVAAGVDVRVVKTLSADEWTSICLPFAMTAEQITAAFGSNVLIGDFNDYELADDENSITVKFNLVTAIAANHPYIIKVSETIEGFTADGVDIDPQEAEINKGTKRRPHSFVGTYEAGTEVEEECLYMSEGSLLYSDGTKSVNAFSGYFDFIDVLESSDPSAELRTVIDESISGLVKIQISYDTGTMVSQYRLHGIEDTRTYNLQGQQIEPAKKGLYINNGRKVVIK